MQICNACVWSLTLDRIAQRARERLQALRTRLQQQKRKKILDAVRAEIRALLQESARIRGAGAKPDASDKTSAACLESNVLSLQPIATYDYVCPFCNNSCQSRVRTGEVDHRNHCGKQFMVANGIVVSAPDGGYKHKCPKCGVYVTSKKKTVKYACNIKIKPAAHARKLVGLCPWRKTSDETRNNIFPYLGICCDGLPCRHLLRAESLWYCRSEATSFRSVKNHTLCLSVPTLFPSPSRLPGRHLLQNLALYALNPSGTAGPRPPGGRRPPVFGLCPCQTLLAEPSKKSDSLPLDP